MDKDMVFDKLNKASFFKDFSTEEKRYFAGDRSMVKTFVKGDFVIREGDLDQCIYVILSGMASVTKNSALDVELSELVEGEMFGAFSLIIDSARTSNVIAKDDMTCFMIENSVIITLEPDVANKFKGQLYKALITKIAKMNRATIEIKKEFDRVMETCEHIKDATDGFITELSGADKKQ